MDNLILLFVSGQAVIIAPLIASALLFLLALATPKKQQGKLAWVGATAVFLTGIATFFAEPVSNSFFLFDPLSKVFTFILAVIAPLVIVYSAKYIEVKEQKRYFSIIYFFIFSMFLLVMANNLILFFIAWELVSIASFMLISFEYRERKAVFAANKCFALTQLGGLLVLAGVALLSSGNMFSISSLVAISGSIPVSIALPAALLIAVGALSKSSIYPFNWLADAMKAPTPVSALLHSATMVNAGMFILFKFSPLFSRFSEVSMLIIALAFLSMIYAGVSALVERDFKRVLAFSTILNLGYVAATLMLFTPEATAAALFHLVNHAFFKAGLFLAAGIIILKSGDHLLDDLGGAAMMMGKSKYALLFLIFAASSLPITNTFLSKWAVYSIWLQKMPLALPIIAAGTMIPLVYYSKIINVLFYPKNFKKKKLSKSLTVPLAIITGFCLLFGVSLVGYNLLVAPVVPVQLAFPFDVTLVLLFASLLLGFALSAVKKTRIDSTGPFTGGEKLQPAAQTMFFFGKDKQFIKKISGFIDIDRVYWILMKFFYYAFRAVNWLEGLFEEKTGAAIAGTIAVVFVIFFTGVF